MKNNIISKDKPTEALPKLDGAPEIKSIAESMVKISGANAGMILLVLLVFIAHALQLTHMIIPLSGKAMRLSFSGLVVASTGKLKTFVFETLILPLIEHQKDKELELKDSEIDFRTELDLHKIEISECKKAIREGRKSGDDISELIKLLHSLHQSKPKSPSCHTMLHNDSTVGAIFRKLHNHLSLLIASSEGSLIAEKSIMKKFLGLIIEVFSGSSVSRNNVSSGRDDLSSTFLSMLIMIQDSNLEVALESIGEKLKSLGYLGRTMCRYVPEDFENGPMKPDNASNAVMKRYSERMKGYYQEADDQLLYPDTEITYAKISPEGAFVLGEFSECLSANSKEGKFFYKILDVKARAYEIVLKLCGVIHFYEQKQGDISAETVHTAIEIYAFFLPDHVSVYNSDARKKRHAKLVHEWLHEAYISVNRRFLPYSHVTQGVGSSFIRNKHNVRLALNLLIAENKIKLFTCGDTACIDLKPYTGNPIREAASELFKFEGLKGVVQYDLPYVSHRLFEQGFLPDGRSTMFMTVDTMPSLVFTGFGKFETDEDQYQDQDGELQEVDQFS